MNPDRGVRVRLDHYTGHLTYHHHPDDHDDLVLISHADEDCESKRCECGK